MTLSLTAKLARQAARRFALPERPRIKVNLYHGYEVRAAAEAARELGLEGADCPYDCLMVADSYTMTHMGRAGTRQDAIGARELLAIMLDLVAEVAKAARHAFPNPETRPFVLGDMPDGSLPDPATAFDNARRMLAAGADVVKVEVPNDDTLTLVHTLAAREIPIVVHLGYTPQTERNRKFGADEDEARRLLERARKARDAGARGLVLERVSQEVNRILCRPHPRALPVWSIFSGRVPYGGQSLNVWDSVFHPDFAAKAFPPTARYRRSDYPEVYRPPVIRAHFAELLRMTLDGAWPRLESSRLAPEALARLDALDPWGGGA